MKWGGRVARPQAVVLRREAFNDVNVREVMVAVLNWVSHESVKCIQQIPTNDAKLVFLDNEFTLGEVNCCARGGLSRTSGQNFVCVRRNS